MVVVLPAPFGPSKPKISPLPISKLTLSAAVTDELSLLIMPLPFWYTLVRLSAIMAAPSLPVIQIPGL
jgi:hypothetical protein